ncbi:MAG: DUF2254 family protein [Methanolobus sp.]|nr:DUF2254 family protein [Methanolobus sp.]
MDNIKKELPVWLKRIWVYFKIFAGIAIFAFILWKIPFTHTLWTNNAYTQYNATELSNMGFFDNERYLLSALVQSLAATIALVITLSLVAVQLAAQSYSARVIDVYKRNPDMWILLCIYIITIFYGLGLIKVVELGIAGINMEGAIFVAYFIGFFAFVCLVPYMLKTLDLLKPSTVIELLAVEITKENILDSLEDYDEIAENDPIQPIVDMINAALVRNDYETVKNGLVRIKNSANQIIENESFDQKEEEIFSNHLIEHVERLGKTAIKNGNERSTISSIKVIEEIGMKAADKNLEWTTWRTISTLHIFARDAAPKDFGFATRDIIYSVERIGTQSIRQKLESVPPECVNALETLGIEQAKRKMDWDIGTTANVIMKIGYEDRRVLDVCLRALTKIGLEAADFQLEDALISISDKLKQLGTEIESNDNQHVTMNAAIALGKIGIKTAHKDLYYSTFGIISDINNIGTVAAKKGEKLATRTSIRVLKNLKGNCNYNEMTRVIDNYIEELLEISTKMGWDMSSIIEELAK